MTRKERWIPYLFLLPAFSLLLVFRFLPVFSGFREALYADKFTISGPETIFVGINNFTYIFSDPVFLKSLKTTMIFSLVINPLQTTLAFGLAVLANQRVRGIQFFRTIYLLPVAISLNVTTMVWRLMLDSNFGMINGILAHMGIARQPFLNAESHALWSIIAVASWKGVFFWMLFFLAGLQGIPQAIMDAAAIDGANAWQAFTRVTIPLMRRVFLFVLVADTIINFVLFVPPLLLTGGGPQLSTNLLMLEAYRKAFVYGDSGGGGAMAVILIAIMAVVVGFQFYILQREEV